MYFQNIIKRYRVYLIEFYFPRQNWKLYELIFSISAILHLISILQLYERLRRHANKRFDDLPLVSYFFQYNKPRKPLFVETDEQASPTRHSYLGLRHSDCHTKERKKERKKESVTDRIGAKNAATKNFLSRSSWCVSPIVKTSNELPPF